MVDVALIDKSARGLCSGRRRVDRVEPEQRWNGEIHQLDAQSGEHLCTLAGHASMVFGGVRFLPDGRRAVSADGDLLNFSPNATLRLWDLTTCRQLAILRQTFDPAFHPDGDRLFSAADDDTVREWRVDTDDGALLRWIEENRYVTELTCAKRATYYATPLCAEIAD